MAYSQLYRLRNGIRRLMISYHECRSTAGPAIQFSESHTKWKCGSFVQNLLRISRWWQRSIRKSVEPFWALNSVQKHRSQAAWNWSCQWGTIYLNTKEEMLRPGKRPSFASQFIRANERYVLDFRKMGNKKKIREKVDRTLWHESMKPCKVNFKELQSSWKLNSDFIIRSEKMRVGIW